MQKQFAFLLLIIYTKIRKERETMLRVITLLTLTTVTAFMVRTVYRDMVEEARYSNFISSGRFLTEEYNHKQK